MVERPASWKKLSAISQASADAGFMAVKMERTYHRNDEDETEVEIDNVAKGKILDANIWSCNSCLSARIEFVMWLS